MMISICPLVIILLVISETSAVSYNQPNLSLCASWSEHATTVANRIWVGQQPVGIFINDENTIYVADRENGRILMWLSGSSTPTKIISGNLTNPWSLFVTIDSDIYIDNGNSNDRVDKWTSNATYSGLVMKVDDVCTGLFVDINYNLYCSSMNNHRVLKSALKSGQTSPITRAGTGCPGPVPNMLDHPHGIFVDKKFNLYVADTQNNRIQFFAPDEINAITVAGFGAVVYFILNRPTGVILDADGYLFIVDSNSHRIIRSISNGFLCLVGCSGNNGATSNQLNNPQTMAFDKNGNIFVTDFNNHRIQKFSLDTNSCDTPLLYGVQLNLDPFSLPRGWSLCYNATYASPMGSNNLPAILSVCNKTKLLLGCRPRNSKVLTVAAAGNRTDVLYDCGSKSNCVKDANGVGWYYSDSYSWGFVRKTDSLFRNYCDTNTTNAAYRLCWHTKNDGGYRCGSTTNLNSNATWEKVIYHAN